LARGAGLWKMSSTRPRFVTAYVLSLLASIHHIILKNTCVRERKQYLIVQYIYSIDVQWRSQVTFGESIVPRNV
jgi:hypothetical protein